MSVINLKAQLKRLVELQKIDSEIYALKNEQSLKPQEIKLLEEEFERKKEALAQLEKETINFAKQKKEKELDLATKEESIKKLQTQLYSLKTNKEYQAMLQQIQDVKADISVLEDRIIEILDKIEEVECRLNEEKNKIKEEEKIFLAKKNKIEERLKQINERLSQMQVQRKEAAKDIDPKILSHYERILANRDGLAIVLVKDSSCGGCNMLVPPQVINLIKMYERIITCEVCNRMLYLEETIDA